jgi:hypothetical protein
MTAGRKKYKNYVIQDIKVQTICIIVEHSKYSVALQLKCYLKNTLTDWMLLNAIQQFFSYIIARTS